MPADPEDLENYELIEIVREYEAIVPMVYERLKTYSTNSHLGSPSEKCFIEFEKMLERIAQIKRFGRPLCGGPETTAGLFQSHEDIY